MNATDLLVWGIVIHLVVDWLGQNEWIAVNKAKRRTRVRVERLIEYKSRIDGSLEPLRVVDEKPPVETPGPWWDRHPAAYIHAGMHGAAQLLVFPWWAALAIGVTHLLIDTRVPVAWWSKLIRQTQPSPDEAAVVEAESGRLEAAGPAFDIGADVRIWADQVWHIGAIALVALAAA